MVLHPIQGVFRLLFQHSWQRLVILLDSIPVKVSTDNERMNNET